MKSFAKMYHVMILLAFCSCSCTSEKTSEHTHIQNQSKPDEFTERKIIINEENAHLIFTFQDDKGEYHSVSKIHEVPEIARKQVIVTDLSLSGQERNAAQVLYITDLTVKKTDGSYGYSLISRVAFEKPVHDDQKIESTANLNGNQIIIYSTRWCGVCKKTKKFFTDHKISFVEKDIEGSQSAMKELNSKLAARQMSFSGVPVIDVKGKLVVGFDEETLLSLIGS